MRKELMVYIGTTEPDIEASVRSLKQNNKYVVIDHEGHRFSVSITELKQALTELEAFTKENAETDENNLTDFNTNAMILDVEYPTNT